MSMATRRDFPVLETERLVLRQLRAEDAGELFAYFSLDEVTAYYDLDSFEEPAQAAGLLASWQRRFDRGEGIRWGITLRGDDRVIGTCGFHEWPKGHYKAEVGYELAPAYWRQGLMTEALASIIPYGFEALGLNRIEAFIDPDNDGSRRLLEKSGLREEGHMRDYYYEKGRFVDAVLFACLKRTYAGKAKV
ncbi:ribosomal-protein-alanine N-acetyltransferase [Paenibacillus sp. UNC496MF]|nr:ribosomal-protein-alanine N-acetyltransferase [Paenibacillus sp. UNC496MF]